MAQRVPDEYFRPAAESDDVRAEDSDRTLPDSAAAPAVATPVSPADTRDGWSARAVASMAVVVLGVSFAVGRLWVFPAQQQAPPEPTPSPVVSAPPSPPGAPDVVAPYDGPVAGVQAISAEGRCAEGGSREAPLALVDNDSATIWRCRGDGAEESVTLRFPGVRTLVGLRVVNGNTVWTDRYLAERRILTIRWRFADGSFFDQGLAANDRAPQEVRFPATETDSVTLTILDSTDPGGTNPSMDAVSISVLDFLGPA